MMSCHEAGREVGGREVDPGDAALIPLDSDGIHHVWRQILSNLVSHAHALETLLVFARRGLARLLRDNIREQAHVVLLLEERIREVARQGARLSAYAESNFGGVFGARTWPGVIESLLGPVECLAMHRPSTALVIVNACDRASIELFGLSRRAARRCGLIQLEILLESLRAEAQTHLENDVSLLRRFPMEGFWCRRLTSVILSLWVWDLSGILGRRLEPRARRALVSTGISEDALRRALERIARECRGLGGDAGAAWADGFDPYQDDDEPDV